MRWSYELHGMAESNVPIKSARSAGARLDLTAKWQSSLVYQMASTNGPHHEESYFCRRIAPRRFLQLLSRLLPKIHFAKRKRQAHYFFSDLIS